MEGQINLYLIRHGQSTQNAADDMSVGIPDHAVGLTDTGRHQAEKMAVFMSDLFRDTASSAVIWCSPYKRTRETAEFIMEEWPDYPGSMRMKEDAMLSELQFGLFDGVPAQHLPVVCPKEYAQFQSMRRFNGKFYARRPMGESPLDCEMRQRIFLESLYRDINSGDCPETVVIVGHGAALTLLRKAIFHYTPEWYEKEPNPGNCSVQQVILEHKNNQDRGYIYGRPE